MAWDRNQPIANDSLATSHGLISANFIQIEGVLGSSTLSAGITLAQGMMLLGLSAQQLTDLPKDANATRYISNRGASNNPSWMTIRLTDGVDGILPEANGGTGSATLSGLLLPPAVANKFLTSNGSTASWAGTLQDYGTSLSSPSVRALSSMKICWGYHNGGGSSYQITNLPFSDTGYAAFAIYTNAAETSAAPATVIQSASAFTVYYSTTATKWLAIGY